MVGAAGRLLQTVDLLGLVMIWTCVATGSVLLGMGTACSRRACACMMRGTDDL